MPKHPGKVMKKSTKPRKAKNSRKVKKSTKPKSDIVVGGGRPQNSMRVVGGKVVKPSTNAGVTMSRTFTGVTPKPRKLVARKK